MPTPGCAFNDHTNKEETALVPAKETSPAPVPSGSGLPVDRLSPLAQSGMGDLLWKILEYTPCTTFILGKVSRGLNQRIGEGVRLNITEIFNRHSSGNHILCKYVQKLGVKHAAKLERIRKNTPGANPISDAESRLWMISQASLVNTIRSLGVVVPGKILLPEGFAGLCNDVQRVQDFNSHIFWRTLRMEIMISNPGREEVPAEDAPLEDVRAWMQEAANASVLRRITNLDLSGQGLTCIPMEIRFCKRLSTLNLSGNRLTCS
jgi:hypothetical protein